MCSSHTHPIVSSNQMQFVHNEQVNVLNVLSLFPTSTEHIPELRDTNNNATLLWERERAGGGGEEREMKK